MDRKILEKLFSDWSGKLIERTEVLPISGSERRYIRIFTEGESVMGVFNENVVENKAYFSFTESFLKNGVLVPKIFQVSDDSKYYLVEDLGDDQLFDRILQCGGQLSPELKAHYHKSLEGLVGMQVVAHKDIDYSKSFPIDQFNQEAIQWDLNYFKYNYLKLSGLSFDEYLLEADFKVLMSYLLEVPTDYFMFRDFQSRNIMIKDDQPYFIDFQGGRKGPLVYDVASLLFQAKAQLSNETRSELFDYYESVLLRETEIDAKDLKKQFYAFALLRTLQVLGAYGFRGFFEKKPHFIESIPYAIANLKYLLNEIDLAVDLPYLRTISNQLKMPMLSSFEKNEKLTVSITSFSYRKGIPTDPSQNGGGYVFDCRSIHNPGRYEEYKTLTGKDKPVIDFFEKEDEMESFLNSAFKLVDRSVEVYMNRGFKHLMVNFGCTGGQHRSVYSAESLAKYLSNKYDIIVSLWHREQDK